MLVVVEDPVAGIPAVARAIAGMDVHAKPAGEPTFDVIADAARAVEAARPEVIVGVGGGSALISMEWNGMEWNGAGLARRHQKLRYTTS